MLLAESVAVRIQHIQWKTGLTCNTTHLLRLLGGDDVQQNYIRLGEGWLCVSRTGCCGLSIFPSPWHVQSAVLALPCLSNASPGRVSLSVWFWSFWGSLVFPWNCSFGIRSSSPCAQDSVYISQWLIQDQCLRCWRWISAQHQGWRAYAGDVSHQGALSQ